MKKLLLTATLIVSCVAMLNAQCVPGSYTSPGIYPDTATNLDTAYVGIAYSTVITAVIPVDTIVPPGISVNIDSIGILGISGFPTGSGTFAYAPNNTTGNWAGGTSGCVLIYGNPTTADIGTYPLEIRTKTWATLGGLHQTQLDTIFTYRIIVKEPAVINEVSGQNGISFITYPDPDNYSNFVKILSGSDLSNASIIVNDIAGRELIRLNNLNGNDFTVNKGQLTNGIYFISLISNNKILARRKVMVK